MVFFLFLAGLPAENFRVQTKSEEIFSMLLKSFIPTYINNCTTDFTAHVDETESNPTHTRIVIRDQSNNEAILWLKCNRFDTLTFENESTANTVEVKTLAQLDAWAQLLTYVSQAIKQYQINQDLKKEG